MITSSGCATAYSARARASTGQSLAALGNFGIRKTMAIPIRLVWGRRSRPVVAPGAARAKQV